MRAFSNIIWVVLLIFSCSLCRGQEQPDIKSGVQDLKEQNIMESNAYQNGIQNNAAALNRALAEGDDLVRNGKSEEAMRLYKMMLQYLPRTSPYHQNIYSQLANLYNYRSMYSEALTMYYLALKETRDTQTRVKLLVNVSAVYIDLKDYEKALKSLDQTIALLGNAENGYWSAIAHGNKGSVYNAQDKYSESIIEFRKAYRLSMMAAQNSKLEEGKRKGMNDFGNLTLNNIADTYMKQGMLDSALYYLQLTQDNFKSLSQYSQCAILVTLGQLYCRKGNYAKALNYLRKGLAIGEVAMFPVLNKQAYETMALANSKIGNYKEAWLNQKKYTAINDSLISTENINKINIQERKYDLSLKDKELVKKELFISLQAGRLKEKNWLAGVLVFAILSLGSIFLLSRRSHRNKQKLLNEQLNSSLKDRKIMQIEAGMQGEEKERTRIARELHDGVVSELLVMKLNLQAMGKAHRDLNHSDEYRNIIFQAGEVTEKLRQAAHNLMPANLKEYGLIQAIGSFLEKVNNHNIQFTFQYYGEIPVLDEVTIKIILMMVMELTQNILKHARATEAIVQLDFFADSMSITVEDNGVGIPDNMVAKKGIGLANIESNVLALNGTLDIKSSEYTGTTMLIEIPLNGQAM